MDRCFSGILVNMFPLFNFLTFSSSLCFSHPFQSLWLVQYKLGGSVKSLIETIETEEFNCSILTQMSESGTRFGGSPWEGV